MLDLTCNLYNGRTTKKGVVVLKQQEVYELIEELERIRTNVIFAKDWTSIANEEINTKETLAALFTVKVIHDKLDVINDSLSKVINTFE